jgi:hypothetical protein
MEMETQQGHPKTHLGLGHRDMLSTEKELSV